MKNRNAEIHVRIENRHFDLEPGELPAVVEQIDDTITADKFQETLEQVRKQNSNSDNFRDDE